MARNDMMYDGRRMPPRNSRGEFMSRGRGGGRGRRGDRGMDYGIYPEMRDGRVIRSYPTIHPQGDYGYHDMPQRDYEDDMHDYRHDMPMGDGHYQHGRQSRYEPVEFMGYCQGYYGSPDHDYGRRGDYGYDMRGRRDYGYDYGYDYGGDYGEALSSEELQKWQKKLMEQLDEREKQMFRKEAIIPKFKQMGIEMKDFNEEELYTITLAQYTDHKQSVGQNPDLCIKLARDFMVDPDSNTKGSERTAIYYDTFVED